MSEKMKNCYFCGAGAPQVRKFKGIWKMECLGCGSKIEHQNYDSVIDMWNYEVADVENK